MKSDPIEINSVPDHIHLLFAQSRTMALSDLIGTLKKSATDWLRGRGDDYRAFHWQNGYGAFSVSQSSVKPVRGYIRNQEKHHRKVSFQDEFRQFLKRYEMQYDERYLWD